jgi:hypothetical protein
VVDGCTEYVDVPIEVVGGATDVVGGWTEVVVGCTEVIGESTGIAGGSIEAVGESTHVAGEWTVVLDDRGKPIGRPGEVGGATTLVQEEATSLLALTAGVDPGSEAVAEPGAGAGGSSIHVLPKRNTALP